MPSPLAPISSLRPWTAWLQIRPVSTGLPWTGRSRAAIREGRSGASPLARWVATGLVGAAAGLLLLSSSAFASAASGGAASPAGGQVWKVAPAGPCARIDLAEACSGGRCRGESTVRSRFDAGDVASLDGGRDAAGALPPEPIAFRGPGPCADPSSPCGSVAPPRAASSQPPVVPPPTGVIEQPTNPGGLPGDLPGLP